MNQDSVKALLIRIEPPPEPFDLMFTGKSSRKVNGFYRPEEKKIYIHNRNLKTDQQLLYTAIHEYAHHFHTCTSERPLYRFHTKEFRYWFHSLLQKAEAKGIYQNPAEGDAELKALAREIREHYLKTNGELMKEFGRKLTEAQRLCQLKQVSFEDYADRVLGLGTGYAKRVMRVASCDLDASVGYENMKRLSVLPRGERQAAAVAALKEGSSPVQVERDFAAPPSPPKPKAESEAALVARLQSEKSRLEFTIGQLSKKLRQIESRLTDLNQPPANAAAVIANE